MIARSAAVLGAALLAAGCGYIGEPLPPLLHIPSRVADMTAQQHGARIVVDFTAPRLSTEGAVLRQAPTLDLRAGPGSQPWNPETWASEARRIDPVTIRNGRAHCEIPVDGWPGREVVIAVKAVGANGRDAGWSHFLLVAVAPPPERPAALRAEAVAEGVRVSWQANGPLYRVHRRAPGEQAFTPAADTEHAEWIDPHTEYGKAYAYLIETIVKTASGEAHSDLSEPVGIVPVDTFPPRTPAGLTAVASTGSVELVWDRNIEPDFAVYRVYRAAPGGDLRKVAETGSTPSYSDHAVEAGKTYRYAVTAADAAGNESKPCDPVEIAMP